MKSLLFKKRNVHIKQLLFASVVLMLVFMPVSLLIDSTDVLIVNTVHAQTSSYGTMLNTLPVTSGTVILKALGDLYNKFNPQNALLSALLYLINVLLAMIISLVGGILALVGFGFDQAIGYTITNFSTTFAPMKNGVNTAWSAFRDIANIIMISMFVFVAFSVILNKQTYGLKNFGARILIVALLINFSLFFTKAIIDVSNITATQFYNSITMPKDADGNSLGISSIFFQKSGLSAFAYSSAGDNIFTSSFGTLQGFTKGTNVNGFGIALLYTMVMVIFYSALIMVLSYGLILLITRMVTFIVLMITSSLAFASYLIPKYGDSLWNKWWGSLINNALFAPIFMLMLWATVKIIGGLTSGVSNKEGTLSDLAKGDGGAWNLVFGLMIIVGLLYASTKIGSELAIAGEKFAKKVGMKGFTTGLRAGGISTIGEGVARAGWGARRMTAQGLANSHLLHPTKAGRARAREAANAISQFDDTKFGKNMISMGFANKDYTKEAARTANKKARAAVTNEQVAVRAEETVTKEREGARKSVNEQQQNVRDAESTHNFEQKNNNTLRTEGVNSAKSAAKQYRDNMANEYVAAENALKQEQTKMKTAQQNLKIAQQQGSEAEIQRAKTQINAQDILIEQVTGAISQTASRKKNAEQRIRFIESLDSLNPDQQRALIGQRTKHMDDNIQQAKSELQQAKSEHKKLSGQKAPTRIINKIRKTMEAEHVKESSGVFGGGIVAQAGEERGKSEEDVKMAKLSARVDKLSESNKKSDN